MKIRSLFFPFLLSYLSMEVDSSTVLAGMINHHPKSRSFRGIPKLAKSLPLFNPSIEIEFRLVEMLFSLGRIVTPRIGNLADLCSTWAILRYIWAFDSDLTSSKKLRLSDIAMDIDFHQKALMSDEIGVGIAVLITEKYFGGLDPIDIDVALRNNIVPGLRKQYSTSPDYLFTTTSGEMLVVECKGTRCDFDQTLKQLKRGTEQVPSLIFPSKYKPLELVIATKLSRFSTNVYLIDPPDKKTSSNKRRKDDRRIYVIDEDKFQRDVEIAQISNLYLYTGVNILLPEATPREKIKIVQDLPIISSPPDYIELPDLGGYVGKTQVVNTNFQDFQVSIFQGISESIYKALDGKDMKAVNEQASFHYQKVVKKSAVVENEKSIEKLQFPTIFREEKNQNSLTIFSRDGRMLRLLIES